MKFTSEELEQYKKEKMKEIDEYLDQEYGCSYTRLDELFNFIIDQNMKREDEKDKEIERLNNVLIRLEKELKNRIKNVPDTMVEVYEDESILNKLQELKGANYEG